LQKKPSNLKNELRNDRSIIKMMGWLKSIKYKDDKSLVDF